MLNVADILLKLIPANPLPSYLTSYEPSVTPLSETPHVVATLAAYLATIFSIQWAMKGHQPLKLSALFQAHNIFLTAISGLLLVLITEEIAPIWWKTGTFDSVCHARSWTPRLEFYYMVNYYIKYVELIDTVFMALKKKQLPFLHVFHHSATALLCYTQLNGQTVISWVPITLNLAVHVVMYYYYARTARGAKIWWKKYLTTMQITQFLLDLVAVYFAVWQRAVYRGWVPAVLFVDNCSGSEGAAFFGAALLTSYLGLFIDFYLRTYKKPVTANGNGTNGKTINGNGKAKAE